MVEASRTVGVNGYHYESLQEAGSAVAAGGASIEQPDEITLLADLVLDEPLIIDDRVHVRLVAGGRGSRRTIRRSANLIEFPVLWVRGDSASLSLGKPDMDRTRTEPQRGEGSPLRELVVDGGFLNSPPIEAHAPLVAVSGPDSKLIMYDKVTLQNNKNSGSPIGTSHYENGAGVFIRTEGNIADRKAEFVMKGGTIRGNTNDEQSPIARGGGVLITGLGIFTMEGGAIMNNTAYFVGGGFSTAMRGIFKKTGGTIYGANAPVALRNTALEGEGGPKTYGHRSEERRVGKECESECRSRWSPYH
jgi:hypothetical protein